MDDQGVRLSYDYWGEAPRDETPEQQAIRLRQNAAVDTYWQHEDVTYAWPQRSGRTTTAVRIAIAHLRRYPGADVRIHCTSHRAMYEATLPLLTYTFAQVHGSVEVRPNGADTRVFCPRAPGSVYVTTGALAPRVPIDLVILDNADHLDAAVLLLAATAENHVVRLVCANDAEGRQ